MEVKKKKRKIVEQSLQRNSSSIYSYSLKFRMHAYLSSTFNYLSCSRTTIMHVCAIFFSLCFHSCKENFYLNGKIYRLKNCKCQTEEKMCRYTLTHTILSYVFNNVLSIDARRLIKHFQTLCYDVLVLTDKTSKKKSIAHCKNI